MRIGLFIPCYIDAIFPGARPALAPAAGCPRAHRARHGLVLEDTRDLLQAVLNATALDDECALWDWVRTAGISAAELRQWLIATASTGSGCNGPRSPVVPH